MAEKIPTTLAPSGFSFGDKRLDKRAAEFVDSLVEHQSVKLHQLSPHWATNMAYYRLFENDKVTQTEIITGICSYAAAAAASDAPGTHYLTFQDTTQPNFQWNQHNIKENSGLGVIGDGESLGFFLHPSLTIRASDGGCVGFTDIQTWTRSKDAPSKEERHYHRQPIEEKESYRWVKSLEQTAEVLPSASTVTVIEDREGDIFELFTRRPSERVEVLVRSRDDRCVVDEFGCKAKLQATLSASPVRGSYQFLVRGDIRTGRTERIATVEVRYTKVELKAPARLRGQVEAVTVWAVEARETQASVPVGEKPIHWRLLTTHKVESFEQACEIIKWYSFRWYIETLFRLLKKQGFNVERAELERGDSLIKLTLLALWASLRVMSLYLSTREEKNEEEASKIFSTEEIDCLKQVGEQMEGKTEKQKNPNKEGSLKWASWIIARLGGWKGYASQRKAGIITFYRGLQAFEKIFLGWQLMLTKDMYKP